MMTLQKLTPPATKPHLSVAKIENAWYVACQSKALKPGKLFACTILGTPLVLFRDGSGEVGALQDRCPHRNVPLRLGRVEDGTLECSYHGWRFATSGRCLRVPGLLDTKESRGRDATSYAAREQSGLVWVYMRAGVEPASEPFRIPSIGEKGVTTVVREVQTEATAHATIENALDVPHTAFLHRGLFRGSGKTNEITAQVRRYNDRVEVEYLGEPRPEGLVGRILSPSGGLVTHFDRFFLPSVAQVEYSIGTENHFLVTALCTPVTDFCTRMFAVISFRLRIPGWLVKPFIEPIAMRIFRQDARVLKAQTESVRRFGGEQYVSTEIDLIGAHVWRLMKQAESEDVGATDEPVEKQVVFRA